MEKQPEELYRERVKRVTDAIELRVPDRVPISINFSYFPARYGGVTYQDSFYDMKKWKAAYGKVILDYAPDMFRMARNESGEALDLLDYRQMRWPGHGLSPFQPHQWVEGEYMKAEEYDQFIEDPSDFVVRTYLPRAYGALGPLASLKHLGWMVFGGVPPNQLAIQEVTAALEMLLKAARLAREWRSQTETFITEMRQAGFPSRGGLRGVIPFDAISTNLRGMRGIMVDMFRRPDKLRKASEKLLAWQIERLTEAARTDYFSLVYIPLHRGADGFMSMEQFDTFYWPDVKKIVAAVTARGLTPYLFFEGNYTSRLHHLLELPTGKVLGHFDSSDIVRVKELLGEHMCIMGNVPSSILQTGTPRDVENYCRDLIDTAGKGGGLILSPRSSIDDAKAENIRAMVDFTQAYGKY